MTTEIVKNGHAAVQMITRYGETKAHLETALHHLHAAMAITPWFAQVELLAELANEVASATARHTALFEEALVPNSTKEREHG